MNAQKILSENNELLNISSFNNGSSILFSTIINEINNIIETTNDIMIPILSYPISLPKLKH